MKRHFEMTTKYKIIVLGAKHVKYWPTTQTLEVSWPRPTMISTATAPYIFVVGQSSIL